MCVCHLRGTFFFQQLFSKFLISLRNVFQGCHMGISTMQWHIAEGVQFYCKAPILRIQFVFDSYRFYHIFLFILNCDVSRCFSALVSLYFMFRKSLKNMRHYFNHIGFWYLFSLIVFICWSYVLTWNKIQDQKIWISFFMSLEPKQSSCTRLC